MRQEPVLHPQSAAVATEGVVRERILPRSVVVTAEWVVSCDTDYVYPAFVTLLADISCLLFRFYLWLIGQFVPAVSLPD